MSVLAGSVDESWYTVGLTMYFTITISALVGWAPFLLLDALRARARTGQLRVGSAAERLAACATHCALHPRGGDEANGKLRMLAWCMSLRNFAVLAPLSLAGGPLIGSLLGADEPRTTWGKLLATLACQLPLLFLIDDLCFWAYHRALHENKVWYVRFHKAHHVFTKVRLRRRLLPLRIDGALTVSRRVFSV